MRDAVYVLGVGMVPFTKPGASESYDAMGATAARAAVSDAGIDYSLVRQAYVGYVYGDSTCGQAALYRVGMAGIPVVNVNNNCSTGSTALFLARQAVESGVAECALALGFEQMPPGALTEKWADRPTPLSRFFETTRRIMGWDEKIPMAPQMFAGAGREYRKKYGATPETFARISEKARRHAAKNPNAIFKQPVTVAEVLASPMICDPLTRLQCCPPTCGAAAAVLCSRAFAKRHGLRPKVVIKANRKIRESWRRRMGYLLYNLECRALFDLSVWDINGTPKVFPRSFTALLNLARDDDLSVALHRHALCTALLADTGCYLSRVPEACVEASVRVQPGDVVTRGAIDGREVTADQDIPIRLDGKGVDIVDRASAEGCVEASVRV